MFCYVQFMNNSFENIFMNATNVYIEPDLLMWFCQKIIYCSIYLQNVNTLFKAIDSCTLMIWEIWEICFLGYFGSTEKSVTVFFSKFVVFYIDFY